MLIEFLKIDKYFTLFIWIPFGFDCVPRGSVYFRHFENSSQTIWRPVWPSLFPFTEKVELHMRRGTNHCFIYDFKSRAECGAKFHIQRTKYAIKWNVSHISVVGINVRVLTWRGIALLQSRQGNYFVLKPAICDSPIADQFPAIISTE